MPVAMEAANFLCCHGCFRLLLNLAMTEDSNGLLVANRPAEEQTTVFNFDVHDGYRLLQTIGTGAYGVVCSAIHKASGQKVAIKKIANPFDILMTAKRTLRELKLLLHFKHDNIVAVKNILHRQSKDQNVRDVYVIMDLMESDLHHVIRSQQSLTENHICYFIYQLLRGLKYIHSANVIHRDLKPSNLLVNENCELKIGDFGMARGVANSPEDNRNFMTEYVATRWYRAPELMLSMSEYSMAIDMWSVGCIFAEMIGRKQIFPGRHYVHQLQLIISVLGSPSTKLIRSIRSDRVRSYVQGLPYKKAVPFKALFPKASGMVIDLLSRFLQFDPSCRENADVALQHPFFQEYHDQDDEPNCPTPFDFRFEMSAPDGAGPTKESVKKQVIDLINEYHMKKNRMKKQFIFVPKSTSEIQSPNATPEPSEDLVIDDDATTITLRPVSQNVFKKPSLLPVNKSTAKSDKAKAPVSRPSSTSVEMMSANSETPKPGLSENDQSVDDVIMLNDKSSSVAESKLEKMKGQPENQDTAALKSHPKTTGNNVKKTISETTKMLVRDMILSSMLAKKNGLTKPADKSKKPITAAERQREREEKRRKRQEKAAEKERKKREADGNKRELSQADKSLLERWSKMQAEVKSKNPRSPRKENTTVSPNALTRQNSLPSLLSPKMRTVSNTQPITPRRWSLNSEQSAYPHENENQLQYVPTLSDIPPSPMTAEQPADLQQFQQWGHPSHLVPNGVPAHGGVIKRDANFIAPNQPQIVVEEIQPKITVQHFGPKAQTRGNLVQNIQDGATYRLSTVGDHGRLLPPSTLGVIDFNQNQTTSSGQVADSTSIPSAKSLVNLSPDTVDFVLNQQLPKVASHEGNSLFGPPGISSEDVLTLSPGKMSLVVRQSGNTFDEMGKSASIEFSPQSFLLEMDKISQAHHPLDANNTDKAGMPANERKFFDTQNGLVMLSESAVCNRNEMLYVNSNLTHNPLKEPVNDRVQGGGDSFNRGMVGGYGIGYEPEGIYPAFDNTTESVANTNNIHQQTVEMDCGSAKSSSSLLNDWLEATQMGQHDIEQLQRELELGSPMCIDDFSFKPD